MALSLFRATMPRVDDVDVRAQRLSKLEVLADIPLASLRTLAERGIFRDLKKDHVLWHQGLHAYEVAFVWSGQLAVVRRKERNVNYRVLKSGEAIGYSNAIGYLACTVDVKASVDSRVLILPGDALRALIPRHPEIAYRVIASLGRLVGSLTDEIEQLHRDDLSSRLLTLLKTLGRGQVQIDATHAELAAHVGAKRESVSRALGELDRQGHIERGRGWIRVLSEPEKRTRP